jgi:hypothetical protein
MPLLNCDIPEKIDFIDWPQSRSRLNLALTIEESEEFDDVLQIGTTQPPHPSGYQLFSWEPAGGMVVAQSKRHSITDRFASAIQSALGIVQLKDNWDSEGSVGYSLETYNRMKSFLMANYAFARDVYSEVLPIPAIDPADNGSFDVFWKLEDRTLLLNFPAHNDAPVTYYGSSSDADNTIAGRTKPDQKRPDLVAWLIHKMK